MSSDDKFRVAAASLVSGAIAGVVGVGTAYPLETIRVRLQTQRALEDYRGFWDCIRKTVRGEGVRGLYKGMTAPLLGSTLTKTIDFGTYGFLLSWIRGTEEKTPPRIWQMMVSGTMSAAIATVVLCPIDRAKILLQIQRTEAEKARAEGRSVVASSSSASSARYYKGPLDIARQQGWRGMYHGMSATVTRETLYGCLYFAAFNGLKRTSAGLMGLPSDGTATLPFPVLLLCGGTTGAIVWTVMFPVDVVKSILQASPKPIPRSMLSVARQHYAAEGLRGFWKGLSAAIIRSFPAHGVVLATYSTLMDKFVPQRT